MKSIKPERLASKDNLEKAVTHVSEIVTLVRSVIHE